MINIISKSYISSRVSGPKKVVENVIKGLEKIGYPYVINKDLASCKRLWIHDDVDALRLVSGLPANIGVVIGPNLFTKPANIPKDLDVKRAVFVFPSKWIRDFWIHFGYDGSAMDVWPAGIDTDDFNLVKSEKKIVMLYYKQRSEKELQLVEDSLRRRKITYKTIVYREYTEHAYRKILSVSKYGIWLGRHESQGIALEEALACGVPLIVWDVDCLGHWKPTNSEKKLFTDEENQYRPVTVAEYFDSNCGIKVSNATDFNMVLDTMEREWKNFNPRQYIIDNLDYRKQAMNLLRIYQQHFGLSIESGRDEKILKSGNWVNNRLYIKLFIRLKDFAKFIINVWTKRIV